MPPVEPSRKKREFSPVWDHFVKTDEGAMCNYCGVFIKLANNTSNILNHLRRRHPDEWESIKLNNPKYWGNEPSEASSQITVEIPGQEPLSVGIMDTTETKPKRKRSRVWKYFNRINDAGITKCLLCGLLVKSFHTTSNLFNHLKSRHVAQWKAVKKNSEDVTGEETDSVTLDHITGELLEYDEKEDSLSGKVKLEKNPKRIFKSPAWRYFEVTRSGSKCTLCGMVLKTHTSTSNLLNHLRNKHSTQNLWKSMQPFGRKVLKKRTSQADSEPEFEQITEELICYEPQSPNPVEVTTSLPARKKNKKMAESNMDALIDYIVTDEMPLNISELRGFRHFIWSNIPEFEMPTQAGLRQMVENRYVEKISDFKNQMENANSFSLAVSEWTDMRNCRNLIGVTCHFVQNSIPMSATIGVEELFEDLTEDLLVQRLDAVLRMWHIEKPKVQSVVVTGETPMITNIFTKIYGSEKVIFCFAHGLNFIAKKPFEALTELHIIMDAIKQILDHLKHGNEIMVEDYEEGQELWDLIYTTPTTWKGLLQQMENFVKYSDKLEAVFVEQAISPETLAEETIHEIKDIIKVYKPLMGVVSELIKEDRMSVSKVIPLVHCLSASLSATWPETRVGINTKQTMLDQITSQFSEIEQNDNFCLATLIDPRFKKNYFKEKNTKDMVEAKIKEVLDLSTDPFTAQDTKEEDGSIWKFHMSMVENESDLEVHPISLFLSTKVTSLKGTDPIRYFATNHTELRAGAERLLNSSATCTPPRIIFSESGNTIRSNWATLPIHDLRRLMFLKSIMN